MQLKEEYRTYESLRREHDAQIIKIAMEAGLRISPEQWSTLLYGNPKRKSDMQSIIDKVCWPHDHLANTCPHHAYHLSACTILQHVVQNVHKQSAPA